MAIIEALEDWYYDGRMRKKGEQFEASDEDARLLSGWEKVKVVAKAKVKLPDHFHETIKPILDRSFVDPDNEKEKGKRRYMRRDMRARE